MLRIIICSLLHNQVAGHTLPAADHIQEVVVHNLEGVVRILEVDHSPSEAVARNPSEAVARNPSAVAVRNPFVAAVRIPFGAVVHIPFGAVVHNPFEVAVHSPSGVVGRILIAGRILPFEAVGRSLLEFFLALLGFHACSFGTVAIS